MAIYEFEGKIPVISESSFIYPDAVIIGDVNIGEECYVGAGAIIRGDFGKIIIGKGSNVQENTVIHADHNTTADIGENVLIGHSCIIHGHCYLGNYVTVGMGAIVAMNCEMEEGSFLAMGSILSPGKKIPAGKLAMGSPAKVIRDVDEQTRNFNKLAVKAYSELGVRCLKGLKLIKK